MVFNDGQAMIGTNSDVRAQNVLDNLNWRREIPVIIAVFINPGRTPEQPEPNPRDWGDRNTNRPEEYNRLNDKYPRVIVDELMPVIKRNTTSPDRTCTPSPEPAQRHRRLSPEEGRTTPQGPQHRRQLCEPGGGVSAEDPRQRSQADPDLHGGRRNDNRALRNDYQPDRDWHCQNVRLVETDQKVMTSIIPGALASRATPQNKAAPSCPK
jgi:enterochelin esterase family protein